MSLPNSSITVKNTGSGATTATHLVGSNEYQVMIEAEVDGHIKNTLPIYNWCMSDVGHSNTVPFRIWDIWNGSASNIIRVLSIKHVPIVWLTITGTPIQWRLARTTSASTGGGFFGTLSKFDTTAADLDAGIVLNSSGTGGAAEDVILHEYYIHQEETNTSTQTLLVRAGVDIVPPSFRPLNGGDGIVIRPSQGLRLAQITASNVSNSNFVINFSVE